MLHVNETRRRPLPRFRPPWLLFLVAALSVLNGCASVSFDEFKDVKASRWPEREEAGGLIVSCRPVTAPEEVEFFFSSNLIEYNILPVAVYLENRGSDTITFKPEEIVLTHEDGSTLKPLPWRTVHERVAFSYTRAVPGFFFCIIPGFMIAHSVSVANERLQHNYHRKALEEFSLPPGDHVQGVVFLCSPEEHELAVGKLEGADMRLLFLRRNDQQTSSFEVFFHLWGVL